MYSTVPCHDAGENGWYRGAEAQDEVLRRPANARAPNAAEDVFRAIRPCTALYRAMTRGANRRQCVEEAQNEVRRRTGIASAPNAEKEFLCTISPCTVLHYVTPAWMLGARGEEDEW
jgi:hypothetical protein